MTIPDDAMLRLLGRTLGRTAMRGAVIASNLANLETPGYKSQRIAFSEELDASVGEMSLRRSDPQHLGGSGGVERVRVYDEPTDRMREDGNTVDLDREMSRQAAVEGRYRSLAQLIRKRFALMRYAVTDGRG